MMKSVPLLTVVLLGLSFAGSAQAALDSEELLYEQWTLNCDTPTPSPGHCGIYWAIQLTHVQDPSFLAVAAGYDFDKLLVAAFASGGLCATPASTMQVDGYPPAPLQPEDGANLVPVHLADETISQFNNGTMLFLRVHMEPDCALSEYPIPLPGFSEAWSQIPR